MSIVLEIDVSSLLEHHRYQLVQRGAEEPAFKVDYAGTRSAAHPYGAGELSQNWTLSGPVAAELRMAVDALEVRPCAA